MPAGNRGEALVHREILPGVGRRDDYQKRGGGDGEETEGGGVDCCRRLEHEPWEGGWQGTEKGDRDGDGDGRLGGSGGTFIPETTGVVSGL